MSEPASDSWEAPSCSSPIKAIVRVPGSKSATARAIYVAAVAAQPTRIVGALDSRDTSLMVDAVRALGAGCDRQSDGSLLVTPVSRWASGEGPDGETTLDVGLAGTVMRFLPLLAALRPGVTHFVGDAEASARPVAPVLDLVRQLGADVACAAEPGRLPFSVRGVASNAPLPVTLRVDAAASSQFLSAALLVAPLLGRRDGRPRRIVALGPVVSVPHVEMTCEVLAARGVRIERPSELEWLVYPGLPSGGQVSIEPDLTNAGVLMAAVMLCGGELTIPDWPGATTQAGDAWRDFFTRLGAQVRLEDGAMTMRVERGVDGSPPAFDGLEMDFSQMGELTATAVAVLLFASTPSVVSGVEHIRGHETDRVAALATEIQAVGGDVREREDGLDITPTPDELLRSADLRAYADHRMATFGALVGLRVPGVTVDDIGATSKTLPDFPRMWSHLLAHSLTECEGVARGTA